MREEQTGVGSGETGEAGRKRLAVLTPLPPVRSGIASYATLLLPELRPHFEVTAVVDQPESVAPAGVEVIGIEEYRRDRARFDAAIGQLGNNPYHDYVYEEAMERPMHIVLHDLVLHHLIVERTLAKNDPAGYEAAILESEGEAGAAFARGRSRGLHAELGNFLFPASAELARRSKGVIVHNRWAGERLREAGVGTPIIVVAHPYDADAPPVPAAVRAELRRELGYEAADRVIGMFGFVTGAKRPEAVFEAFARARKIVPSLRLLVVGEPAPNIDLPRLGTMFELPPGSWRSTGYVSDDDFARYMAAVDRVVNLRYPTAGEMSGPLIQALRLGRPVAISELGQFAEIPREVAARIPLTGEEGDALVSFMTREIDAGPLAGRQRAWLASHASMESVVAGYLRAIDGANEVGAAAQMAPAAIPLVPQFEVERLDAVRGAAGWRVTLAIRNGGPQRYRAAAFGEPALRLVFKAFDGDRSVFDRWLAPHADLGFGDRWETTLDIPAEASRITIQPAISDIPQHDSPVLASKFLS